MRILCRHGHIAFYPRHASDVARFTQYFGIILERSEDFYTFPTLVDAPRFTIKGTNYLGLVATVTYEGHPWEIMRENGLVYNVNRETLSLKGAITTQIALPLQSFCYLSQVPLVQPGSRNSLGNQILSYDGEYNVDNFLLKITEFAYE